MQLPDTISIRIYLYIPVFKGFSRPVQYVHRSRFSNVTLKTEAWIMDGTSVFQRPEGEGGQAWASSVTSVKGPAVFSSSFNEQSLRQETRSLELPR
jgi:hypothetical protein